MCAWPLFIATVAVTGGSMTFLALTSTPLTRLRLSAVFLGAYVATASSLTVLGILTLHFHSETGIHLHNPFTDPPAFYRGLADHPAATGLSVAALIVLAVFVSNQYLARRLLRSCLRREDRQASIALRALSLSPTSFSRLRLVATRDGEPDAYSFSVLRARGMRVQLEDVIVVTAGLRRLLPPDELRVALVHETIHARNGDGRYMPFLRVLSSLVFFDPIVRLLLRLLCRRCEFRADEEAALETGRPLALARALFRVSARRTAFSVPVGLLGGQAGMVYQRIERLLELARRIDWTGEAS